MFSNGFPKEWSTLRKLAWLYRTVINAVVSVLKTIIGNPIHITDALAKPAQALSIALEPIQDLHGYDNPWPAGGGTNQWDEETEVGGISPETGENNHNSTMLRTKNYIPIKPDTHYYLFCAQLINVNARTRFYDENKAYIGYVGKNGKACTWGMVFTPPINAHYLRIEFQAEYGTTYNHDIAINYPSAVTTYSPYSNICPISGWTGASVTRTGKNLFDKTSGAKNLYVGSGDKTGTGGTLLCFVAKAGSQYTISMTGGNRTNLYYYETDSLDDIVAGITLTVVTLSAAKPYTFTADHDAIYCYYADTNYQQSVADSCMVELGSTATAYEPYQGDTYSITFPTSAGTVYGGTLDVTTGKLTVDRAMLGNVNWSKHKSYSHVFYAPAGTGQLVNSTTAVSNVCVLYSGGNLASFASDSQYRFRIGDRIYINVPSVSNVTDLNTWITNNSLQICFELATPVIYDLTPTEVTTLLGTNNLWSDGTMTLVYLADGNASDIEALNILLGNRYVNNHEADEPTDREALNIILGGNER